MLSLWCCVGVGTAVFSDLSLYLQSLERMKQAAEALGRPSVRLYPGHGPTLEDGVVALGDYVEHRMARVRQVAALLGGEEAAGPGRRGWTAEEVTRVLYAGVPEKLIPPATSVTTLVLRKLRDDGEWVKQLLYLRPVWVCAPGRRALAD